MMIRKRSASRWHLDHACVSCEHHGAKIEEKLMTQGARVGAIWNLKKMGHLGLGRTGENRTMEMAPLKRTRLSPADSSVEMAALRLASQLVFEKHLTGSVHSNDGTILLGTR